MNTIVNSPYTSPDLQRQIVDTHDQTRGQYAPFLLLKPVDDSSISRHLQVKDIASISLDNFARSISSLIGRNFTIETHLGHRSLREVQVYLLGELHGLPEVLKTNSSIISFLYQPGDIVLTESNFQEVHFSPPSLANRFHMRRWDIDHAHSDDFQ